MTGSLLKSSDRLTAPACHKSNRFAVGCVYDGLTALCKMIGWRCVLCDGLIVGGWLSRAGAGFALVV